MGNWQEVANSVFIALVFAFMVAKLISLVISFRDDNLRVERNRTPLAPFADDNAEPDPTPSPPGVSTREGNNLRAERDPIPTPPAVSSGSDSLGVEEDQTPHPPVLEEVEVDQPLLEHPRSDSVSEEMPVGVLSEAEHSVNHGDLNDFAPEIKEENSEDVHSEAGAEAKENEAEEEKQIEGFGGSLLSDEDEWEGVESTELDETFGAAAAYVASTGANLSQKITSESQAQLYGLYKVATEGPCTTPQPSPLKITARAKWFLPDPSLPVSGSTLLSTEQPRVLKFTRGLFWRTVTGDCLYPLRTKPVDALIQSILSFVKIVWEGNENDPKTAANLSLGRKNWLECSRLVSMILIPIGQNLQVISLCLLLERGAWEKTDTQYNEFTKGMHFAWHAWQRLGNMNPEAAMEQYISLLTEMFPSWIESIKKKNKKEECDSSQQSASSGGMTSVFSSYMHQEGSDDEVKLEVIHTYAREADKAGLLQVLEQGVPVDLRDSLQNPGLGMHTKENMQRMQIYSLELKQWLNSFYKSLVEIDTISFRRRVALTPVICMLSMFDARAPCTSLFNLK
eukprot:Gb_02595 [translate_table: standard]